MGKIYAESAEMRAKISASMKARAQDPEWLRQNSEARKGKPSRGGHVTNHERRGLLKPGCPWCDEAQAEMAREAHRG